MGARYLDDFAVGDAFTSGPVAVTEADILAFARQFDPQPFHMDHEAAGASMFAGLAASGWHTAALTMRMLVDAKIGIVNGIIGVGVEQLNWPRAVRPGDRLTIRSEVLDVRPSQSKPDRGILRLRTETLNQDGAVVQSFIANLIVKRRMLA